MSRAIALLWMIGLLGGVAAGAPASTTKGLDWPQIVAMIERGDSAVLELLRDLYVASDDKREKQSVAVTLLHLGDPDPRLYAYLERFGKEVVDRMSISEDRFAALDLLYLAQAGDPRSFELLVRALRSADPTVVDYAATGLGYIGDPRAIGPIREAIERMPEGMEVMMAVALSYIDDPRAEALVVDWVGSAEAAKLIEVARQNQRGRDDLLSRFEGKY